MDLEKLVRNNIRQLKPYSCARNEFSGGADVWLDANESPYNAPYNRYPDPMQTELKRLVAQQRGVQPGQVFLGVGSDECIDMVYRVFCRPGVDNVVAIEPTYGMYEVCAAVNDVEYRRAPLGSDFSLDISRIFEQVDACTKVVWICSPNNPTGNAFPRDAIEAVCAGFSGIVVVDEAYVDFSSRGSMASQLSRYPNLVVLQTMSKAWASAAVRLGAAFASTGIVDIFNKVKYPYNINLLTQRYAIEMLGRRDEVRAWVAATLNERERLRLALGGVSGVECVYPSDANFLLVKIADADAAYARLLQQGIVVRNRNRVALCGGCLRLTVGTAEENDCLIKVLSDYGNI